MRLELDMWFGVQMVAFVGGNAKSCFHGACWYYPTHRIQSDWLGTRAQTMSRARGLSGW